MAGALIVLGALLILLAPETSAGMALLALGVFVELIGTSLNLRRRKQRRDFHESREKGRLA